jgi:GTP cyclohydrolase I
MTLSIHSEVHALQFENAIRTILKYAEHFDGAPRQGLAETPTRAAKAWKHWLGGYDIDPASLLKTFEDGGEDYDEMVLVKDLPFYSHCEHHLAAIFGRVTIGYVPNGRIVGLSKLGRVVDAFSRRLQVQERLTVEIANCLNTALEPRGVAVQIKARHLCMESRGICQQGHTTTTQALRGVLFEDPKAREEFIQLAKSDIVI